MLKQKKFKYYFKIPLIHRKYIAAIFEYLKIRDHVTVLSCVRFDHVSDILGQPIAPSYVPGEFN